MVHPCRCWRIYQQALWHRKLSTLLSFRASRVDSSYTLSLFNMRGVIRPLVLIAPSFSI